MVDDSKKPTHAAWAFRREGKKVGRFIEIGTGRIDLPPELVREPVHVFLDRLPIGGFSGYVMLYPIGRAPPLPEPKPRRPCQDDDIEEDPED